VDIEILNLEPQTEDLRLSQGNLKPLLESCVLLSSMTPPTSNRSAPTIENQIHTNGPGTMGDGTTSTSRYHQEKRRRGSNSFLAAQILQERTSVSRCGPSRKDAPT
jgi:hypothetical protein